MRRRRRERADWRAALPAPASTAERAQDRSLAPANRDERGLATIELNFLAAAHEEEIDGMERPASTTLDDVLERLERGEFDLVAVGSPWATR